VSSSALEVRVGGRIWFDGEVWTVCEIDGSRARLLGGGKHRTSSIKELLADASAVDDPVDANEPPQLLGAIALASLTSKQRARLEKEVATLAPLLGAPSPGVPDEQLRAAAQDLGIAVRTARRRLSKLREQGPSGLVDERLLKDTRRSVDPRWDEACTRVLAEYTNQSTPSKQTVIRRANQAFFVAVPGGVAPSRAVAYRRLEELDHGRYTFGEAKQRRSVAKRPKGVLGQLHPTRPGEYVLMDGYKLDVFAMEPVTMRWVNTELTVAMDLFDRSQGDPPAAGGSQIR